MTGRINHKPRNRCWNIVKSIVSNVGIGRIKRRASYRGCLTIHPGETSSMHIYTLPLITTAWFSNHNIAACVRGNLRIVQVSDPNTGSCIPSCFHRLGQGNPLGYC